MSRVTGVFGPDVKPVHVGVYRTRYRADPWGYSYWDGTGWSFSGLTVRAALVSRRVFGGRAVCQEKLWRGLKVKP